MTKHRKPKATVTMRRNSLKTLHEIVKDPDAGSTARSNAARFLLRPDEDEQAQAEAEAAHAARGRPMVLMLPNNGSAPPEDGDPCGIHWNSAGFPTIIYETEADRDRWLAEVKAILDKQFPPEMLALPKPKPMTGAERSRNLRARRAAEKAKAAAT